MGSITLGDLVIIASVLAIVGSLLYLVFRPSSGKRPGLPELTREEFDTRIDKLVEVARWFVYAAEHRKKISSISPEQRRAWVIERLKMYAPIVPGHLWDLAVDAVLGEIDEAKATMTAQPEAVEPSSVSEFEVDEAGRLRLVSVRANDDMLIRARTSDPLGLGWNDPSYPDHRGARPPGASTAG